jgi:hypothetical protein
MAIRKEWTEWHLTPRGWQQGSTRREGRGNEWRDEPADRLLSYQHIEIHGSAGQPSTIEPNVSTPKIVLKRLGAPRTPPLSSTWRLP